MADQVPELSSMAKESRSMALVKSLESSRGCEVKVAGKRTGFNGISILNGDIVRKIEIKTVDKSDDWFAINGVYGIESLTFDPQYFLYFVLSNPKEQRVVVAHAVPFMQQQIPGYNSDARDDIREWLDVTKALNAKTGLNIIPRVNFKLKTGIRSIVNSLEAGQNTAAWSASIESIWHQQALDSWLMTFPQST